MHAILSTSALVLIFSLVASAPLRPIAAQPAPASTARTIAHHRTADARTLGRRASDPSLIANALSAAPPSVAANATVVAHDGRVLRKGSNAYVCMPDMPDVPNNTPMCLDAPWRSFIDAWMKKGTPTVTELGFGYMLQGDMPVSNTDPFATAPTADNQWIANGDAHVMVLIPDKAMLARVSSDPKNGGPFVMWRDTPFAHLMVPIAAPKK